LVLCILESQLQVDGTGINWGFCSPKRKEPCTCRQTTML
jgi:hypothetical protein